MNFIVRIKLFIKWLVQFFVGACGFTLVFLLVSGRTNAANKIFYYYSSDININAVVDGEVVGAELKHGWLDFNKSKARGYRISYTYTVNAKSYRSDLTSFSSDEYYEYFDRYPVGAHVRVYYDAESPAIAVLENDKLDFRVWLQCFAILFASSIGFLFSFYCSSFVFSKPIERLD